MVARDDDNFIGIRYINTRITKVQGSSLSERPPGKRTV